MLGNLEFLEKLQDVTPILEGRADETEADIRETMTQLVKDCRERGIDTDTAVHLGARFVTEMTVEYGKDSTTAMFFIIVYAYVRKIIREIESGENPESETSTEKEV